MVLRGIKPRKRLGQHFLVDRGVAERILDVSGVERDDTVVEIGPGDGILTEGLLKRATHVIAIEIDRRLAGALRERFRGWENLELIQADALGVSYTGLSERYGKRLRVVANLPYNISTPILIRFIDQRTAFSSLTLMFQKEVARRITAPPGTKDYGVLSVLAQVYMDTRVEFDLPPQVFKPRPRVDSSVVTLIPLPSPRVRIYDEEFFRRTVRCAFGKRRKTLLNALMDLGVGRKDLSGILKGLGIDERRRGETLNLQEFSLLTGAILDFSRKRGGKEP